MNNVLDTLYTPDDILGVNLFGIQNWNRLKGRVCGLTEVALRDNVNGGGDVSELFCTLFRPNVRTCCELLGSGAISWLDSMTTSSGWWNTWMKAKDTGESIAELIPVAQPFVSAGRKLNDLTSNIWDKIRGKENEEISTATKAGLGIGSVLLLAGAGYLVYSMTKKKKGRR